MGVDSLPMLSADEWRTNLVKDGGRRVLYGGNAYEDDLEPCESPEAPPARPARGE
jgi:hypothetical protein